MSIGLPGFSTPATGPEAPLEMLAACHEHIERRCASLRRLVPRLVRHGADARARMAAASVMRCFDASAQDHHADEEESLFPALIESMAGSDAVCMRELTRGLTAEHCALEAAWQRVRAALAGVAAGESALLAPDDVEVLVNLCQRHIEREESELLPMAARLLSDGDLAHIGRAMRERRKTGGPGSSQDRAERIALSLSIGVSES